MLRALLIFCCAFPVSAATWYVRPGVFTSYGATNPIPTSAVYGSQDGTSYANAWNGITSIVWGGAGVNTGDTIYLAGTHVYKRIAGEPYQSGATVRSYIGVPGVTIRGDYPGDAGVLFGGCTSATVTWSGPDADGVYWRSYNGDVNNVFVFEVNGTNITHLSLLSSNALKAASSGYYSIASPSPTNYVKLLQGAPSAVNTATSIGGWTFHMNKQSNTVFQALSGISCQGAHFGLGGIVFDKPVYASDFYGEKYVSFIDCAFRDGTFFYPLPGQDFWTFSGCSFRRSIAGVYSAIDQQTRGPWNMTITNCWFEDIDTPEYPDGDAHGIGCQGCCNWVVVNNRLVRNGTAIDFWTGAEKMTNNLIQGNYISDTHIPTANSGSGITIEGLNTTALPGTRTEIRILNNVLVNIAGRGIDSNNQDAMDILNNTIVNAKEAIHMEVITNFLQGRIFNNIIASPTNYYFYFSGTRSNMTFGHNLFYPTLNTTNDTKFLMFGDDKGPSNVLANPLLTVSTPTTFDDAGLQSASPARNTGTNVGLPFQGTAPDIGAIESVEGNLNATTINAAVANVIVILP